MPNNVNLRDATGQAVVMKSTEVGGIHTPQHRIDGYDPQDDMLKVKSVQKKMRDGFAGAITDQWDVNSGLGVTAAIASGELTVTSGTTAGGFFEMLSKETFTVPFRAVFGVLTGTRVANTHDLLEAVSIDPVTGLPDGKNSLDINIGGSASTTVTQMIYGVQSASMRSLLSSAATIVTTNGYTTLELETFSDEAYFHSRVIDSTAGRANSYARHQMIPDPNAVYKIRYRHMNHANWINVTNAVAGTGGVIRLTTATHGASTGNVVWVEELNGVTDNGNVVYGNYTVTVINATTIELDGTTFSGAYVTGSGRAARGVAPTNTTTKFTFIGCHDYAELTAEITAGRGQVVEGQAVGVKVLGTAAVSGTVTTSSSSQTITLSSLFWNESTASLAASATLTGTSRDIGSAAAAIARYNCFRAFALANQAGTMRIEASNDNSTWYRVTADQAVAANTPVFLEARALTRYHRVVFVNGATAQTSFFCNSGYSES